MLVLTRKAGESLMIGDQIELVVLEVKNDGVRLGIKAPNSIPVFRKEVFIAIQESNKEALQTRVSLADLGKMQTRTNKNNGGTAAE